MSRVFCGSLAMLWVFGCEPAVSTPAYPERLSDHGLFVGALASQIPVPDLRHYDINTPLFSDYAAKLRFVQIPKGQRARYQGEGSLDFPIGTVLVKTFYYALNQRVPAGPRQLVETRLLIREPEAWVGLPYVWNQAQTEARLQLSGSRQRVTWINSSGVSQQVDYEIPSSADCGLCHNADGQGIKPLGTTAAQLHRVMTSDLGRGENQLALWNRDGLVAGLPSLERLTPYPMWRDHELESLDDRARAYLDVNCAHCHNPEGPASGAALDLRFEQRDPRRLGVFKRPVAAGQGSGGRLFSISPGRPDESILLLRLESSAPGVMMPELGRALVHREGVSLIRAWIAAMEPDTSRDEPTRVRLGLEGRAGEARGRLPIERTACRSG